MTEEDRQLIEKKIWDEVGIDFTGILLGEYSINNIKTMLVKALVGNS